jgi:hypothetical protein
MGGGLMQLVAYGAQDIYLTGNPQITFFKVVYRRHTNFAMECVEQTLSGTSTSTTTSDVNCTATVSRNGDLVGKMYVTSSDSGITDGADLVKQVDVEIGGQRIDRHYKEWMQVWSELSTPESKALGVKAMTGCVGTSGDGNNGVGMVQVPLQFWFNRNPGLALPLIALQYHEVKIKLTLGSASGTAAACKLWADYIYLDTDERRRFAQVSHEYLIEQLQREESASGNSHKLNFNHPVKELIWTSAAANSYLTAKLVLNGHDRFAAQEEEYFQLRQPVDHHTAVPGQNLPSAAGISRLSGDSLTDILTIGTLDGEAVSLTGTVQAAVASGDTVTAKVSNSTLVNGALSTTAATFVATTAGMTAANTAHIITKADLGNLTSLSAGDTVLVTVSGNDAYHKSTTLANTITTVRSITNGSALDNINALDTVIQFNTLLIENKANVTTDFKIHAIKKLASSTCRTSQLAKKINVYSFALKPEEHQPSGTCNFSRIDNAKLITTGSGNALTIYAVNYNVLRVMSGMGGLAYSN